MGRRRRHLFVLLFVLGLVILSGIVIASKPTKLGLDLKGGLELVYQGTPTGQVKEVSGTDIERAIEIIRQRIDQLGVSEPEVARLGNDEITVSLPDITDPNRAREQVGTTAQLYFYDWEPSLIGREHAIGGHPGRNPPAGALKEAKEEWKEAGRVPKKGESAEEKKETKEETEQLIFSPTRPPTAQFSSQPNSSRSRLANAKKGIARPPSRASTSSPKTASTN
jgi:SecD/SecF fusion protein